MSYILLGCAVIAEQNKNKSFVIFPNPNNGDFSISIDLRMNISIINELGQIVKTILMNELTDAVYVTGLGNGIYFIVGQKDNQVIRQKIIVAR